MGHTPEFMSSDAHESKRGLADLFALAQLYRGWSARELAEHVGRDVHNMLPQSGVPKVDVVVRLADALEWSGQDVLDALGGEYVRQPPTVAADETWESLDRAAHQAIMDGRFREATAIARREHVAATSPDQRARACHREMTGWDGLGRYALAIAACRRGLGEVGLDSHVAVALELNLALFHYLLGEIREAKGMAFVLVNGLRSGETFTDDLPGTLGFAHYVLGSSLRVSAGADPRVRSHNAGAAIGELTEAHALLRQAAAGRGLESLLGVAEICEGGILEMQALIGQVEPRHAIERCLARLDDAVDPARLPVHRREAIAWWCVFGCNTAVRHIEDPGELERVLAILTNKADEIAALNGNWVLRERVWTFELARRNAARAQDGESQPWIIDREDAKVIAGAMSRFPVFRETGWQVLRDSQIVQSKEE